MRRTAVFFCLGVLIFAALLPCTIVVTPPLFGGAVAVVNASVTRYAVEIDAVSSPLLARITPRHLARASLRSFAA